MNVQLELLEAIGARSFGTVDFPLGCEPTDEVAVCRRLTAVGRALASLELDCVVTAQVGDTDVELMIGERNPPEGIDAIDIDAGALGLLSGATR